MPGGLLDFSIRVLIGCILTSSAIAGPAQLRPGDRLGENGKSKTLAADTGPVVLFPDSQTLYLSFFLDDQGAFGGNGVFVCFRPYGKGAQNPSFDEAVEEKIKSGDDCLAQTNGWQRLPRAVPDAQGFPVNNFGYTAERVELNDEQENFVTHYRAVMTGLQPDSFYEYRISQRSSSLLNHKTRVKLANRVIILTPPDQKRDTFHFAAISDLRTKDGPRMQKLVRERLEELVWSNRADLVILPGDISNQTGIGWQYHRYYFDFYRSLTSFVPFYPIHGNHDLSSDGGHTFFKMFDLPSNPAAEAIPHSEADDEASTSGYRSFYSFDWANAHFVALDLTSVMNLPGFELTNRGSAQYRWLEKDLAANQHQRWRIAYFHAPPDLRPGARKAVPEILQLLRKYRVHLILTGHLERPAVSLDGGIPLVVLPTGGARARFDKDKSRCSLLNRNRFGLFSVEVGPDELRGVGLNAYGEKVSELRVGQDTQGQPGGVVIHFDQHGCDPDALVRDKDWPIGYVPGSGTQIPEAP